MWSLDAEEEQEEDEEDSSEESQSEASRSFSSSSYLSPYQITSLPDPQPTGISLGTSMEDNPSLDAAFDAQSLSPSPEIR